MTTAARKPWIDRPKRGAYWLVLLGVPAVMAALVAWRTEFTLVMYGYWYDALNLVHVGRVLQHFNPAGYPEFLALAVKLFPAHQVGAAIAWQGLLHVAMTVVLCGVMRALGARARWALGAALVMQMHPDLLLGVTKVWDVTYSTALFVAILWSVVKLVVARPTWWRISFCGLLLGLGMFERPNFVLLLPVVFLAGVLAPQTGPRLLRWGMAALRAVEVGLVAVVVYTGCAFVAYGHFDTPHNGPYNLYAGHNALARRALLDDLNAEPSIDPSLRAAGVNISQDETRGDAMIPFYTASAKVYAKGHVDEELKLAGVKFWTLFRPDSKVHGIRSAAGICKAVLALPALLWLGMMVWVFGRRRLPMTAADWLMVATAVLYVLPFLLTNADPRFRTPLDLLMLVHLVAVWTRIRERTIAA